MSLTRHRPHRKAWCAPGTGLRLDVSGARFILTTTSGVGRYSYSFHTAKEKELIQGHLLCKWQSQDLTWCPLKIVRYVKPMCVWNPTNILLHSEQGMYANRCVSVYFSVVKRSLSPCCSFLLPSSLQIHRKTMQWHREALKSDRPRLRFQLCLFLPVGP